MAGRERAIDRGTRLGRAALARLGQELRDARLARGLSLRAVADATGVSPSEGSRIERGQAPRVPVASLFRLAAALGLELSLRAFPGATPIRDSAHVALLADVRAGLHGSLRWAVEVPLPAPGDQRAWDALISGADWRYGVEAETVLTDAQALLRRINLKARDGGTDGVILALRGTRRTRDAVRLAWPELVAALPISGTLALQRLAAGEDPGGSAMVILPPRRRDLVTGRDARAVARLNATGCHSAPSATSRTVPSRGRYRQARSGSAVGR